MRKKINVFERCRIRDEDKLQQPSQFFREFCDKLYKYDYKIV